jgi:hypothetical protein
MDVLWSLNFDGQRGKWRNLGTHGQSSARAHLSAIYVKKSQRACEAASDDDPCILGK